MKTRPKLSDRKKAEKPKKSRSKKSAINKGGSGHANHMNNSGAYPH
jgi:hypothetical protein